jgi:hypothetical protein
VDLGEGGGDREPGVAAGLRGQRVGDGGVPDDEAVDEVHDVEGRAVDGLVGAQAEGRGDRDGGGAQGGDDLVLAAHVVGGGQHLAERRPP